MLSMKDGILILLASNDEYYDPREFVSSKVVSRCTHRGRKKPAREAPLTLERVVGEGEVSVLCLGGLVGVLLCH